MSKSFYLLATSFILIFLGIMIAYPLYAMLQYQNHAPLWHNILTNPYYQHRILWTITQAIITAILTTLISLPTAWALARFKFIGQQTLLKFLMLPFIMPTLVASMGVLALFGHQGLLWAGWQDTPYLLIYGNIFFNLPISIYASYQGFISIPTHRIYAARTLGARPWQYIQHIILPALKPWLIGSACLIFLYCFSGFGLALLLGGQHYATIEVEIYQLIAYELDMAQASVLVWIMLIITTLASINYMLISRHTLNHTHHPLPLMPPTKYQYPLLILALTPPTLFCLLPLLAILLKASQALSAWFILWQPETLHALYNTLRFSLMAVILAILLGICHTIAARHITIIRTLTFLPFMVSPVCLAFGILLCYPEKAASLPLLITLYALLAYPFITKDLLTAWDSLPKNYLNAARLFGAKPIQLAHSVYLPLLSPALKRGIAFASATCIGEFAASLFLSRPEWITLTTLIYQHLGKVGTSNQHQALLLTLLLTLLASSIFLFLNPKTKHQNHQPKQP